MNDRLIKVMEYFDYSPSLFADEIDVLRSSISHILSGRNKPGLELVQKVLTRFPEVSADWLLLGKGEMLQQRTVNEPTNKQLDLHEVILPDKETESTTSDESEIAADFKLSSGKNDIENRESEKGKILVEKSDNTPESIKTMNEKENRTGIKRITVYYGNNSFQDFYPE